MTVGGRTAQLGLGEKSSNCYEHFPVGLGRRTTATQPLNEFALSDSLSLPLSL